jgi:predicted peptidase
MKRILIIAIVSLFALSYSCKRNSVEFLKREVTVGENTYGYRVYVPKERPPGQKLPVMLYLHGSGARGSDNETQLEAFPKLIAENRQNFNFVIVFPQGEAKGFWDPKMLGQAVAALAQTVKEFDGDEKRLYVSGWSLGAVGAWHAALLYPNKFSAVVPVAGRITPLDFEYSASSPKILALARSDKPFEAFAEHLKDTPTWIFHGSKDMSVPVNESREMSKALAKAGNTNFHYTEFEGMEHYSIEAAYTTPELFVWLAKQTTEQK